MSNKSLQIIVKEKEPNILLSTSKKQKSPIPKTLFAFFVILQLFFSLDLGVIKCKSLIYTIILKTFTLFPAILMIVTLVYSCSEDVGDDFLIWVIYLSTQYSFIIMFLILNNKKHSFCSYLENLSTIDSDMGISLNSHIRFKVIFFCTLIYLFKMCISLTYCRLSPQTCLPQLFSRIITLIMNASLDIPLVLYSLVFHFIIYRVKNLKIVIEIHNKPIAAHVFYKSLMDVIEKCKKCFDILFALSLLFKVPDAMITTYVIIRNSKNGEISQASVPLYSWLLEYLIVVFLPSILASRLSNEVDKIKILLHDKLLKENGSNSEAIENFISYIEARPMKFYIYSVIPLNASFPFLIINVFVTYLIVAVQFSHLY